MMTFERWGQEKSQLQRRNNRWICDREGCLNFATSYISWPSDKSGQRIYECTEHLPHARETYSVGNGAVETKIDKFTRLPYAEAKP